MHKFNIGDLVRVVHNIFTYSHDDRNGEHNHPYFIQHRQLVQENAIVEVLEYHELQKDVWVVTVKLPSNYSWTELGAREYDLEKVYDG